MSDEKIAQLKPHRKNAGDGPSPSMVNITVAPPPEKPRKKSLRERYWKTWTTLRLIICAVAFYAGAIWLPDLGLMTAERAKILSWVLIVIAIIFSWTIAFVNWVGPFVGVVASGGALYVMKLNGFGTGDVWFDRGSNVLTLAILCLVLSVFAPSLRGD